MASPESEGVYVRGAPKGRIARVDCSQPLTMGGKKMDGNSHTVSSYPELMTQLELIEYLRIPEVSTAGDYGNVIDNLNRFR